ncbi:hypothetical protein CAI21_08935 [Alkalilimnicola ehrlichii]|uniref:Uncharacterized protein n=1 Tax=Alkalilimnicola ehrlichii TaxID=351052 RepID=A0A3E0WWY7_9GAMM|nr:hypothetical protein [Alkalilimnicola ehrlichii]RFA29937.1 hypothetical protein CAI21_08935 [Alkalilimnicola ehrlichii]RFA36526.1 hypothetical protein CAL65_11210 [Alkalilimnicola ehrlichii]
MTKGLKMDEARRDGFGERIFPIKELCKELNGTLRCKNCNAQVQYVSSYTKESSKRPVAAYLKLWQGAEHEQSCPFTVKGAVEQLVATSESVEGADPLMVLQSDGNYLFRMNVLVDAVGELERSREGGATAAQPGHNREAATFRPSGRRLASYFRSAVGVARIRSLIQESDDLNLLKQLLIIEYKSNKVSWNNFYYDDERYQALYKALKSRRIQYPVAVQVTVKGSIEHYANAKKFAWSCRCYSQIVEIDGTRHIFVPTIRFSDEQVASGIAAGKTYLLVCSAWLGNDSDPQAKDGKVIVYKNVSFGVHNPSQLRLDVGGE